MGNDPTTHPNGPDWTAPIPARATLADWDREAAFHETGPGVLTLGLGGGMVPDVVDLDDLDPHIAVYAPAGAGTSSILRSLTAQAIGRGAQATIIDLKRHSHRWAQGLRDVELLCDIAEIHAGLIRLGETVTGRYLASDELPFPWRRHLVVVEAFAAVSYALRRHWLSHRDPGDPDRSPALEALADVLLCGRAARMHVLLAVPAPAGPRMLDADLLAQATPVIARATPTQWQTIAPDVPAPAPASRRPGRVHLAGPAAAIETQALYLTDSEARLLAAGALDETPTT